MKNLRIGFFFSLAALGILSACGGGSSTTPGGGGTAVVVKDGGTGGANGATVTMTKDGIDPAVVTVTVKTGQTVTFINNDSKQHEIASNPHPQHGSCPGIEAGLGIIGAGQTKVTHNFGNAGTCGYHDHQDDTNSRFQGTIVVQ